MVEQIFLWEMDCGGHIAHVILLDFYLWEI